ncbi:hypothetical protein D9M68_953930 [compost metagenome]
MKGGADIREQPLAPHVHHDGEPWDRLRGVGHQLGQRSQHLRRQVFDDVPAVVFQRVRRGASPGTGHARDHEQFRLDWLDWREAVLV